MPQKDRIYKREFDKIIKKTLGISSKERAYLNEVFAGRLVGGLTVDGLRYKLDEMHYSKENIVSQHRLAVIRANIISEMRKEDARVPAKVTPKEKVKPK